MIGSIIIGILAGFFAGKIMRGGGFGCLWNLLLGVIGGAVGGWVFDLFDISVAGGRIGQLVTAVIGAVIVLYVASLFRKK